MKSYKKLFMSFPLLFFCLILGGNDVFAQKRDIFVLVDVSGTMRSNSTNQEAQSIIHDFILGQFVIETWNQKGWKAVDNIQRFPNGTIAHNGTKICIIPIGNRNSPSKRTKHIFNDQSSFENFYNEKYPSTYRDRWTYLTLAKAWVGSVAISDHIGTAYVFIYTDAQPESTNEQLDSDDQRRVQDLNAAGHNSFTTIGILEKNASGRHYEIQVCEFKSYETIPETGDPETPTSIAPVVHKIKITNPTQGNKKSEPFCINVNDEFNVNWTGNATGVKVQKIDGNNSKKANKDSYDFSRNSNNAKVTFYESGDYKIIVHNSESKDTLFVTASSPFPWWIVFCVVAAIVVVLVVRNLTGGPKPPYVHPQPHTTNPKNTDWED